MDLPSGVHSPKILREWIACTKPQSEVCTLEQKALDWLITAIRHKDGIYLPTLNDMGYTLKVPKEIRKLEAFNHGVSNQEYVQLSHKGWILVDWITEV